MYNLAGKKEWTELQKLAAASSKWNEIKCAESCYFSTDVLCRTHFQLNLRGKYDGNLQHTIFSRLNDLADIPDNLDSKLWTMIDVTRYIRWRIGHVISEDW